jgi:phosphate transport system protein
MRDHTSRAFDVELRELRAHLLAMGARSERLVGLAFDAYRKADSDALADAKTLDAQIDRDDLEIHALILRILALRQPVADDLRFLTTALRLIIDLERVGDEAVNIAERAVGSSGIPKNIAIGQLEAMANDARDMLHGALDAFVQSDTRKAEQILLRDDAVDARCKAVMATMVEYLGQHIDELAAGLCAIRVAKYLERVADHATNIAEEVIFILSGDDVRHGHWQSGSSAPRPPALSSS